MSSRIPQAVIDELLSRTDIVALIDARVRLQKKGRDYKACCPFHEERTPSFVVSATKQMYHCFGCRAGGNAISFLMAYDHLGFLDAVEELAAQAGFTLPEKTQPQPHEQDTRSFHELLSKISTFYREQLTQSANAETPRNYLKQRGISTAVSERFALGFAPNDWQYLIKPFSKNIQQLEALGLVAEKRGRLYNTLRNRIIYPIRDPRGRVIGFGGRLLDDGQPKYLNSPESPVFQKRRALYGLYEALQAQRKLSQLLLVEGYMDVIALAQHGFPFAVATMGTSTTDQHLQQLFRYTQELTFCFDGDRAGREAAWRALEAILPLLHDGRQIRFVFLPQGEDPDSFIREQGPAAFQKQLDEAHSLPDFLLHHLSEKVNLEQLDGLAKLAKLATPYIYKIPTGILQQMLFQRLAKTVRLPVEELKRLTQSEQPPEKAQKPMHSEKTTQRRPSPIRLALGLLLQNPKLHSLMTLNHLWTTAELPPGFDWLKALFERIQQHPEASTGTLLEYWRNDKRYAALGKLAHWEHGLPEDGIEAEFKDLMQKLHQELADYHINVLMSKAHVQQLTAQEKQKLQQLIQSQKNLATA